MNFLECKCCKVLSEQLDLANREKMRLLELLLDKALPEKKTIAVVEEPDFQPIRGFKPWHVKQRELEQLDRVKANEALAKAAKPDNDVESLEELVLSEIK